MIPPDDIDSPQTWTPIYEGLSRETADTFGLVLSSANLAYQTVKQGAGWQIRVPTQHEAESLNIITTYLAENNPIDEGLSDPTWPITRTFAGVWMSVILMIAHFSRLGGKAAGTLRNDYGASAERILDGEWYRITTALLLHADMLHLLGNVLGLGLFATAVCSTAGFGVGGLMILGSGMAGNLANALLFETGHHSIGASTAVFGAVGIAAAHQFIVHWRQRGHRLKAWGALGGGLAILGMMGSSMNTDLTAHFFGFGAGFFIGLLFSSSRNEAPGQNAQIACLLLAVAIIGASIAIP